MWGLWVWGKGSLIDSTFSIFPGCTFEPLKKIIGGKAGSVIRGGEKRAGAGGAPRGSNRWFCSVSGRVRCGERCRRPSSRSSAVHATRWLERMAGHTLPARGVGDANAGAGRCGARARPGSP